MCAIKIFVFNWLTISLLTLTARKRLYTHGAQSPLGGDFTLISHNFFHTEDIEERFSLVETWGFMLWLYLFICELNLLILESWRTLFGGYPFEDMLTMYTIFVSFLEHITDCLYLTWIYARNEKKMKLKPQFSSRCC